MILGKIGGFMLDSKYFNFFFIFLLMLFVTPHIYGESEADLQKEFEAEEAAYKAYIGHVIDLRSAFADQINKELNLICSGDSGMLHGTIEELGMSFQAKRRATIEEARALQLLVMDKFVHAINVYDPIQPYLETKPFSYKQIAIGIVFKGVHGYPADGSVYRVMNVSEKATPSNRNHFFYYAEDPFTGNSIDLFEESYEEAAARNAACPIKDPAVHQSSEKEEELDQLFLSFRNEMHVKHHFECWSIGGKINDKIENIGAKLVILRPATQEQAR